MMKMAKYHVTVERVMRDVLTVDAEDEADAVAQSDALFVERHGEHDYDETTNTVEDAPDDAVVDEF
jgi:hypothetical protein